MPRKPTGIDPDAFFASIAGPKGTPLELHQDFQQLFTGSEQGKRVLRTILLWSRMWGTVFDKDSRIHAFKDGERNLGLKILTAIHVEPKPLPTKATKKPKE